MRHSARCPEGEGSPISFAHASGEECWTAGETALHQMAKQIITGGRALTLPAVWIRVPTGYRQLRPVTLTARRVEVEQWEDGVRPDLVGYEAVIHKGRFDEPRLLIKIRGTHRVGDDEGRSFATEANLSSRSISQR